MKDHIYGFGKHERNFLNNLQDKKTEPPKQEVESESLEYEEYDDFNEIEEEDPVSPGAPVAETHKHYSGLDD